MTHTATSPETETFPDPKRSWKRSGALLGVWVVVWAAVAIFGTGWNAIAQPGSSDDPAEHPTSARSVVRLFFTDIYDHLDAKKADTRLCDGFHGTRPKDLTAAQEDQYFDNDVSIDGTASPFTVRVRFYGGAPVPNLAFTVNAEDDGGSSCISSVEKIK